MTNAQFLKTIQNMQNQNNANAKAVANTSFKQSMSAQKDSQAFNSAEAEKNRQFQLGMSNTSHQREVEDLQRAGLNPILSVNNGAPVTSGATASSGQAQAQKAEIDMQTAGLYANWVMNKANNAMQLKINKLNNANALKMSRISAAAQMASASMAAGAQIYASNISRQNTLTNAQTQKWLNKSTNEYNWKSQQFSKYYENTPAGALYRVEMDGKRYRDQQSGRSGRGKYAWQYSG